jgi:hypothetical protein
VKNSTELNGGLLAAATRRNLWLNFGKFRIIIEIAEHNKKCKAGTGCWNTPPPAYGVEAPYTAVKTAHLQVLVYLFPLVLYRGWERTGTKKRTCFSRAPMYGMKKFRTGAFLCPAGRLSCFRLEGWEVQSEREKKVSFRCDVCEKSSS